MIDGFVARTASGTTYTRGAAGSIVRESKDSCRDIFSTSVIRVVDRALVTDWDDIHALPHSFFPEVGKSLLVSDTDHWQLSTQVVELSVVVYGKEDEE